MSYAQERIDIESRFNTQWAGTTPVIYENTRERPTAETAFVELDIVGGDSSRSLGDNPIHRGYSSIVIKIFIPKGRGMKQGYQLADQAAAVFRDQRFGTAGSTISCFPPSPPQKSGMVEQWETLTVVIPYYRDEIF
jgi:hypothetical protein